MELICESVGQVFQTKEAREGPFSHSLFKLRNPKSCQRISKENGVEILSSRCGDDHPFILGSNLEIDGTECVRNIRYAKIILFSHWFL